MLASITPLGERGRHAHWGVTVAAFLIGASAAGVALGAIAGEAGRLVVPGAFDGEARLAVLAVALLVAIALDLRPSGAPGPRRQVNERWLDEFRGWVYGLGFGAQLGIGVTTVVSSAATYVALLAAALSGSAGRGALVIGCYGLVRGVQPIATAHVQTPAQLVAMHSRLERWRSAAARGTLAVLVTVLALAAGAALST